MLDLRASSRQLQPAAVPLLRAAAADRQLLPPRGVRARRTQAALPAVLPAGRGCRRSLLLPAAAAAGQTGQWRRLCGCRDAAPRSALQKLELLPGCTVNLHRCHRLLLLAARRQGCRLPAAAQARQLAPLPLPPVQTRRPKRPCCPERLLPRCCRAAAARQPSSAPSDAAAQLRPC